MELDIVKLQTTWNDAAGSINSNYAKIADAIAQLKANGGGGGGSGADIDLTDYATKVWVEAKGYITASALTPYALKTDIPSLVGYATEDFVNSKLGDYATKDYVTTKLVDYAPLTSIQGFENRIGGLEGAVPQLNERVSIVEGEVSSLNETVSTGENNLLDRVNTIETDYVTSGNLESAINGIDLSAYLLKADLTKSRIQSTLGISDWALAATKPSYAWSEITSRPTALSQFTDDVVAGNYIRATVYSSGWDADSLYDACVYSGYISHLPSGFPYGVIYTLPYRKGLGNTKPDYGAQLFIPCGDDSTSPNDMFFRTALEDTWNTWTKVITDKNIGNYEAGSSVWSKGLDRITSIPESIHCVYFYSGQPTLGDDINNAKEGSNAYHLWSYPVNGTSVSGGTANIMNLRLQFNIAYLHDIFVSPNFDAVWHRSIINYKCNPWRKFAFTDSNVASATKLQTPRKLWGNSFDGTGDVSGSLDVSGNIKASGNINATSITINGVTITASNGTITVNGNVFATGDITGGV